MSILRQPRKNVLQNIPPIKVGVLDVVREIPEATEKVFTGIGRFAKGAAQSIARSFVGLKAQVLEPPIALIERRPQRPFGEASYTPIGRVEQRIFGTTQPISFRTIGEEVLAIGGEEFKQRWGAAAVPLGAIIGALDITPIGWGKRQALKQASRAIARTRDRGKIFKELKNVVKGKDEEIDVLAKSLVDVNKEEDVLQIINTASRPKPKTPGRVLNKIVRPLKQKIKEADIGLSVREPIDELNWKPLELLIPPAQRGGFMNMGKGNIMIGDKKSWTPNDITIFTYKHGITRNSIHIDRAGNTYEYIYKGSEYIPAHPYWSKWVKNLPPGTESAFVPIPQKEAIEHVFKNIEELTGIGGKMATRETPYNKEFIKQKQDFLLEKGFTTWKISPKEVENFVLFSKKKEPSIIEEIIEPIAEIPAERLPAIIQGETFVLGETGKVVSATKKEMRNAIKAQQKVAKLEAGQRVIREEAIKNINTKRGETKNIIEQLKSRHLSTEDIDNIILEDGTKLVDTVKIKRNADKSLSTVITKSDIQNIVDNYADDIPKEKWEKQSKLVEGLKIPIRFIRSFEIPFVYFQRKGLNSLYDPIMKAGRDAETMKNMFIRRFEDAGILKKEGWFTPERFTISSREAEGIGRYYLGRQEKGKVVELEQLSEKGKKFVEIFDNIIKETETRFFETARKVGKTPEVVPNYAPIMTKKELRIIDNEKGAMDWLFRKHPSFFSLEERMKKVPFEVYELDYREVAARWLDGITQFLNYAEPTNKLKYFIESDHFKTIVKESDQSYIHRWLQDITTPKAPKTLIEQSLNPLSRFLRKGTAIGALGLNYATVLKQALSFIPMTIIEKARPKLRSQYAKAFGINVADLPSITKRKGDIAIADFQGRLGRIFMGPLTEVDKRVAQKALNGLLDKEWHKLVKEGKEITPEMHALIQKRAQDTVDKWMGGFFKGQRPEIFRRELGNFIFMFLYPLTSQLNGFIYHTLRAQGVNRAKAIAEVLACVTAIAYVERSIERLSFQWSDEERMTKDVLLSMAGNVPVVGNILFAITHEREFNISPVLGNFNTILKNIAENEQGKVIWTAAESLGLPRQIRRVTEGMEILEDGGITDNEGKMLVQVQDTVEIMRSFLRGKYGSLAASDWVRNVGVSSEDRRWFIPQVEFLQNGDYNRKAELYVQFTPSEQKELRGFLSKNQQQKLDNALRRRRDGTLLRENYRQKRQGEVLR